jgi:hypothetical protein
MGHQALDQVSFILLTTLLEVGWFSPCKLDRASQEQLAIFAAIYKLFDCRG